MLSAVVNSIALYFVLTYQVVLDKTMIGNVFNTNISEASSYLHPKLILYLLLGGIIPCCFIYKIRINKISRKSLLLQSLIFILIMIVWAYFNASRSLWIDKYSSRLGSRIMPWSYIGNTWEYQNMNLKFSSEQILLPPATFTPDNV
jgi:lipid A ethanolaminephosphotransferase